jgi:two-component system response regulator AdeR
MRDAFEPGIVLACRDVHETGGLPAYRSETRKSCQGIRLLPDPSPCLILIAEDEAQIASILDAYLRRAGFRTAHTADGETALQLARTLRPDLILLDLNLPRRDGFGVLASLRQDGQTPVIVISALDQDIDKLTALRIGADDYVTKPFNPNEVVARVAAVLRRSLANVETGLLRVGGLVLNSQAHEISTAEGPLALTPSEFRLLEHLMRRPGRVFARNDLVDACLPEAEALDRTVDSHVANLRRKLARAGAQAELTTVRGVGYRLDAT